MLEFEEALARVLAAVPAPTSESVSLNDAPGRVLAEPIQSPIDLPIFDNSSMDGYAVRAADVASAKPDFAGAPAPGREGRRRASLRWRSYGRHVRAAVHRFPLAAWRRRRRDAGRHAR